MKDVYSLWVAGIVRYKDIDVARKAGYQVHKLTQTSGDKTNNYYLTLLNRDEASVAGIDSFPISSGAPISPTIYFQHDQSEFVFVLSNDRFVLPTVYKDPDDRGAHFLIKLFRSDVFDSEKRHRMTLRPLGSLTALMVSRYGRLTIVDAAMVTKGDESGIKVVLESTMYRRELPNLMWSENVVQSILQRDDPQHVKYLKAIFLLRKIANGETNYGDLYKSEEFNDLERELAPAKKRVRTERELVQYGPAKIERFMAERLLAANIAPEKILKMKRGQVAEATDLTINNVILLMQAVDRGFKRQEREAREAAKVQEATAQEVQQIQETVEPATEPLEPQAQQESAEENTVEAAVSQAAEEGVSTEEKSPEVPEPRNEPGTIEQKRKQAFLERLNGIEFKKKKVGADEISAEDKREMIKTLLSEKSFGSFVNDVKKAYLTSQVGLSRPEANAVIDLRKEIEAEEFR